MSPKATDKIIEAFSQLMEGFRELQETLEEELGNEDDIEVVDDEAGITVESALVTEVRAAIESIIENEDYSAEDIAGLVAVITESLEEIDPEIFAEGTEEEEEVDDEDDDDDDLDDDDDDLDDEDDDEDELEIEDDDDEEDDK